VDGIHGERSRQAVEQALGQWGIVQHTARPSERATFSFDLPPLSDYAKGQCSRAKSSILPSRQRAGFSQVRVVTDPVVGPVVLNYCGEGLPRAQNETRAIARY
jgi:hypothetical protein